MRFVLLAIACAAMYGRILVPGVLPYGHDTFTHDYPIHLWSWTYVNETSSLPLWIPHLQNGLPTLGSFAWCPFYPTDWLMALNVDGGFRLQWFLALLIAGIGMVLWGRAAGLDVPGRWTAAVAFALSGHLVTLISPGHLQKLQAIAWLPWAMAAVEWGFAHRDRRSALRFALSGIAAGSAVGLQFLASHSQIAYITGLLIFWRVGWSTLRGLAVRETRAMAIPGCLLFGIAFPIAVGISGGVELLPGLETARISNRTEGVTYDEAVLTSYPPTELLEYLFPRFLGDSVRDGYHSYVGNWGERLVSDYVGGGALLLLAMGLMIGGRHREMRLWFLLTLVATLVLSLGRYTPLYRIAYTYLPGFNRFRSPGTQMVLATFAIAALGGLGMTAIRDLVRQRGPAMPRWFLGLGTVAILFPWVSLFLASRIGGGASAFGFTATSDPFQGPLHRTILLSSLSGTLFWMGIFAGSLVAALAFLWRFPNRSVSILHPARWVFVLPIAVLAFDLVTRLQPFISPEPAEPYLQYLLQSPNDVVVSRDSRLPRRVLERGNELAIRPILRSIDVPLGYHPVSYRWMLETLSALGLDSPEIRTVWSVAYVRVFDRQPPDESTTWTLVMETPGWTLWRDPAPPPFARFPDALAVGDTVSHLAPLMKGYGLDSHRPALVSSEHEASIRRWMAEEREDAGWRRQLSSPRSMDEFTTVSALLWKRQSKVGPINRSWATVVEQNAGDWLLRVGTSGPRWIVLSTPPAPGWKAIARSDLQREVPIWRADGLGSLVPWPGGEEFLLLQYRPWSVRLGMFLTLLAVGIAALFPGWCLGRRRRSGSMRS